MLEIMPARLAVEERGPATGPPLVLLHGFTQTARCWGELAVRLGERRRLMLVDLPGHGRSGDVIAGPWATADLLGRVGAEQGSPPDWLGYSMGGRMALHLALAHPEVVRRLVLVGTTAGIADDADRAARRERDEQLARRLEAAGVETFLDEWLAQPLFAGLPAAAAGREERLANTVAGLCDSLRRCGTGAQDPLWDRLPEIASRCLLVHGGADADFAAHAARMASLLPAAQIVAVPGAGHACHLEQPEAVATAVTAFLDR